MFSDKVKLPSGTIFPFDRSAHGTIPAHACSSEHDLNFLKYAGPTPDDDPGLTMKPGQYESSDSHVDDGALSRLAVLEAIGMHIAVPLSH